MNMGTHPPERPEAPRGLRNYHLRPLRPEARKALDALYARGWCSNTEGACLTCGRPHRPIGSVLCWRCRDTCEHRPIRGYVTKSDGYCLPTARCAWCGTALAFPLPRGSWLYDLKSWDHRELRDVPPCVRCGDPNGTQLHHWAPRAIFADADRWPIAPLCQRCHSTWHKAMREASGVSLPAGRLASAAEYPGAE